jgi:hypothetical protein
MLASSHEFIYSTLINLLNLLHVDHYSTMRTETIRVIAAAALVASRPLHDTNTQRLPCRITDQPESPILYDGTKQNHEVVLGGEEKEEGKGDTLKDKDKDCRLCHCQ